MIKVNMPQDIYIEEFDIHVTPYVKSDDVIAIGETALQEDNVIEQEICIAVNVLDKCTDIDLDETLENMDVDYIMYSGLWDSVQCHIVNVEEIRDYIAHREDAGVAIARFLDVVMPKFLEEVNDKLDNYLKDVDADDFLKALPERLNEVMDVVKKDGNADIIRGALKMNTVFEGANAKVDDEQ